MYRDRFHFTAKSVIAIIIGVLYVLFLVWNATADGNKRSEETTAESVERYVPTKRGNAQRYTSGSYPPINPECVYWVPKGNVYHSTYKCTHISKSSEIQHGTIEEAEAQGKTQPCSRCGGS